MNQGQIEYARGMINNPLREKPDVENIIRTLTDTVTLISPGWTSSSSDNGGEDRYPATSSDEERPKDTEIESVYGFNLSSSEDEEPAERT